MTLDNDKRVIDSISKWIYEEYPAKDYNYYLATFKFQNIQGSDQTKLRRMETEITIFVTKLITRVNRKPNSESKKMFNPGFILFPDLPVPKSDSETGKSVYVNNGLHIQGMCAFHKRSRLGSNVSEHIKENKRRYYPKGGLLEDIDLRKIHSTLEIAVDYVTKQISRRKFGLDNMIILPRSSNEVKDSLKLSRKILDTRLKNPSFQLGGSPTWDYRNDLRKRCGEDRVMTKLTLKVPTEAAIRAMTPEGRATVRSRAAKLGTEVGNQTVALIDGLHLQ